MLSEDRQPADHLGPSGPGERPLLQHERQDLLGEEVERPRRRDDGLDVAPAPQLEQPGGRTSSISGLVVRKSSSAWCPGAGRCGRGAAGTTATVVGLSIWMTRSRSPTSMPSSSVDGRRRSRSRWPRRTPPRPGGARRGASEECDTNVVTPRARSSTGELFDPGPAVAEHQPLLPAVQRGDDRGGVAQRADVVERRPRAPTPSSTSGATTRRGPCSIRPKPVQQRVRVRRLWPRGRCAGGRGRRPPRAARARRAGASRGRRRRRRGPRRPRRPARRRRTGRGRDGPKSAWPRATRAW